MQSRYAFASASSYTLHRVFEGGEEGREGLPFLQLYFYPALPDFAAPGLQKLKFKTSWGRAPGRDGGGEGMGGERDAAQIPTSPPGAPAEPCTG